MGKVLSIGILVLLVQAASLQAVAADRSNCALTVRVLSQNGQDVEAPVTVEEKNGRVLEKEHSHGGVQFCDLGILPVTVKVGGDTTCNQVVVRNVRLIWEEPIVLKIISNYEPCLREVPASPVPLCEILLRVSDENDNWIKRGRVEIRGERPYTLMTDEFGRAHLDTRRDIPEIGTVSAEGFEPAEFGLTCSFARPQVEHLITLKRKSAR